MSKTCPACAAPALRPWRLASAADAHITTRQRYRLDRCEECGTARTDDATGEPGDRLYSAGTYSAARPLLHILLEPLRRLTELDRLRFLRGLPGDASLVEVGAGDGRFLSMLSRRGYSARGIDPNPAGDPAVEAAAADRAEVEPGSLDAALLWHVLEHLADPAADLSRVRRWLRPGGRIVLAVPNRASLQAWIGGDRWFHQDVPRHITHFTPEGVERLLERSGFESPVISHLLVEHNFLGMWQTLLNHLTGERNVLFRSLKRDAGNPGWARRGRDLAISVLAGVLLLAPAIVLELAAGIARHGGTIVAVARVR